jgi:hypothetical protein
MTKKSRYEYFRSRSKIGKLENKAVERLNKLGHAVESIRDDDEAVSFFCVKCEYFGCAEFPDRKFGGTEEMHGPLFNYECGMVPKPVVDYEAAWDRVADIFGGTDDEYTV